VSWRTAAFFLVSASHEARRQREIMAGNLVYLLNSGLQGSSQFALLTRR